MAIFDDDRCFAIKAFGCSLIVVGHWTAGSFLKVFQVRCLINFIETHRAAQYDCRPSMGSGYGDRVCVAGSDRSADHLSFFDLRRIFFLPLDIFVYFFFVLARTWCHRYHVWSPQHLSHPNPFLLFSQILARMLKIHNDPGNVSGRYMSQG
jgi:hypothetical protein